MVKTKRWLDGGWLAGWWLAGWLAGMFNAGPWLVRHDLDVITLGPALVHGSNLLLVDISISACG